MSMADELDFYFIFFCHPLNVGMCEYDGNGIFVSTLIHIFRMSFNNEIKIKKNGSFMQIMHDNHLSVRKKKSYE